MLQPKIRIKFEPGELRVRLGFGPVELRPSSRIMDDGVG